MADKSLLGGDIWGSHCRQVSWCLFEIWKCKNWVSSFLSMSVFRCSHCLPDCESTIYTSSVSATPLRRCWPWWWWWWKSPTPSPTTAWCPLCLSKSWPSPTMLTMIMITLLGILSDGPGVTRRTLVWRCSASLTAMFLFLLSGRTRCFCLSVKIYQSPLCVINVSLV